LNSRSCSWYWSTTWVMPPALLFALVLFCTLFCFCLDKTLPRMASNSRSSCFHLPSSWDYSYVSPHLASLII
jgi:hypothetical protein